MLKKTIYATSLTMALAAAPVFAESSASEIAENSATDRTDRSASEMRREPLSPSGKYRFMLKDIQEATRAGVLNAEKQIQEIESKGDLHDIALLYFKDYLDKIASYNNNYPDTLDIDEAFRTELVIAHTLKAFKEKYPNLIYDQSKWMFNSVGGIYANTIILYCSPDEYVVIWGTSLKSYGKFSGYYPFMNEFDVMMRGEMLSHDVDLKGHAQVVYKPIMQNGVMNKTVDTSNLIPGNVRSYSLEPYSYMVSYAQGNMVKAFGPGAIMPGIFVNQDFGGMWAHIHECVNSYSLTDPLWMRPFKAIKRAGRKVAQKLLLGSRSVEKDGKINNYRALDIVNQYYSKSEQ